MIKPYQKFLCAVFDALSEYRIHLGHYEKEGKLHLIFTKITHKGKIQYDNRATAEPKPTDVKCVFYRGDPSEEFVFLTASFVSHYLVSSQDDGQNDLYCRLTNSVVDFDLSEDLENLVRIIQRFFTEGVAPISFSKPSIFTRVR